MPQMIPKIINPINKNESTVLIVPVTMPVMLRPRSPWPRFKAIAPIIIAGIPKNNPGPLRDITPKIVDRSASEPGSDFTGCASGDLVVSSFFI